ncbi:MAG: 30S ribosomal protein S7, partial [Rhodospirillales bacterium]|nr:30S ribosomal protein S7 [Rhodospirillales bacterium]
MSRRHRANPREVLADPRYGDVMVTKFTHALMRGGAKSVAERVLYGAFD